MCESALFDERELCFQKQYYNCLINYLLSDKKQIPLKTFSYKTDKIEILELLMVKDIWVNFNVPARTITFACTKSDFYSNENSQHSSEEDEECDTFILEMDNIHLVTYYTITDNGDGCKLVLQLENPRKCFLKSSNELFKKHMTAIFYLTENVDSFKEFIFNFFLEKLKTVSKTLGHLDFTIDVKDQLGAVQRIESVSLIRKPEDTPSSSIVGNDLPQHSLIPATKRAKCMSPVRRPEDTPSSSTVGNDLPQHPLIPSTKRAKCMTPVRRPEDTPSCSLVRTRQQLLRLKNNNIRKARRNKKVKSLPQEVTNRVTRSQTQRYSKLK